MRRHYPFYVIKRRKESTNVGELALHGIYCVAKHQNWSLSHRTFDFGLRSCTSKPTLLLLTSSLTYLLSCLPPLLLTSSSTYLLFYLQSFSQPNVSLGMFFSRLISWACFIAVTAAWNATDGWQGASAIKFDNTCNNDQRDVIRLAWMDAMNMTSLIGALPQY